MKWSENPDQAFGPMAFASKPLGLGAMVAYFYDAPNTMPLPLWWGSPALPKQSPMGRWNPLLPRRAEPDRLNGLRTIESQGWLSDTGHSAAVVAPFGNGKAHAPKLRASQWSQPSLILNGHSTLQRARRKKRWPRKRSAQISSSFFSFAFIAFSLATKNRLNSDSSAGSLPRSWKSTKWARLSMGFSSRTNSVIGFFDFWTFT